MQELPDKKYVKSLIDSAREEMLSCEQKIKQLNEEIQRTQLEGQECTKQILYLRGQLHAFTTWEESLDERDVPQAAEAATQEQADNNRTTDKLSRPFSHTGIVTPVDSSHG